MRKRRAQRWYQTRPPSLVWLFGALAAVIALMMMGPWVWHGHPAPIAAPFHDLLLLWLLPPVMMRALRLGLYVSDVGCTEWFWPCWRRRLLWAEVTGVEVADEQVRITTSRRTLTFGPRTADWMDLAQRALAATGTACPDSDDLAAVRIRPEEVAEWLGIEPDGALICTTDSRQQQIRFLRYEGSAFAAAIAMAAFGTAFYDGSFAAVTAAVSVALLALSWLIPGPAPRATEAEGATAAARASSDAIEVRQPRNAWRRYAWASLRHVRRFGGICVVSTTEGDIYLPPDLTNSDRLLHAIEQAIAARRRGEALPRMTGEAVPDSALSRAEAEDVSVERGLSVSEGDEG